MGEKALKLRDGKQEIEGWSRVSWVLLNVEKGESSSSEWKYVPFFSASQVELFSSTSWTRSPKSHQGKSHQFEDFGRRLIEDHKIKTSDLNTNSFLHWKAGHHSFRKWGKWPLGLRGKKFHSNQWCAGHLTVYGRWSYPTDKTLPEKQQQQQKTYSIIIIIILWTLFRKKL